MSYEEINFQEKSFVSITPNLFSHSLSFSRRVPILIRIPHRSSRFHMPEENPFARKIYEGGPLLQLEQSADTRRESVFRVGAAWTLVTFVLNRRRDPDILSASSLTCRYRYIGSARRRSTEKRSLFFFRLCMHARDRLVYFSDTIAPISLRST